MAEGARGSTVISELFRLAIVVALTAGGFAVAPWVVDLAHAEDPEAVRLITSLLGALFGYVIGGVLGRGAIARVDTAQARLASVDSAVLVSSVLSAIATALFGSLLLLPLLVLPGRAVTLPLGMAALVLLVYGAIRIGAARSGDLSRYVGVRGRVEVTSPSRGRGTKLVDSSVLMDGRIVEVARAGFLEGTVVIPSFVLQEVQALADAEHPRKRAVGRRGLDTLRTLRDDGLVTVEFTDEDPPAATTVDGKLAVLCRERSASLITNDGNLAEIAEAGGIRVLNVHALAEAVRPPAVPGDRVTVRILKEGSDPGQGVGYLDDGTMVVVERAADRVGEAVTGDVTSIVTNRRGRLLFAVPAQESDG